MKNDDCQRGWAAKPGPFLLYLHERAAERKANNELAGSPTGSLVKVKRGKGYTIFRVYSDQGKRVRKVITQNEEMINALARKVYLYLTISSGISRSESYTIS